MTVRLLLLGSPLVQNGSELLALPFERRTQLLAFLALKRAWVGRAELAALLWPDQQAKLAYTNLRKTLHRVQSLPWSPQIEVQGSALRFQADTDVLDFEAALRENRIANAVSLRRGELLAGFDDAQSEAWSSWLNFERDRLRVAWRSAVLEQLSTDIETREAIDLSRQLLDADCFDEAALREHMSWLARDGQLSEAKHAYRQFAERLERDLGLAPGSELKALHDSLGIAPAARAVIAPSVPTPESDGFIGRTVELRRIATLLAQDDCRLLTIIGPGGAGKTRLARRALQESAPAYADGGVFIALDDIVESNDLGGRFARELGINLTGSKQSLEQVITFLCNRHMLLVMDNFEHLVANASILDKLLTACPKVKIIVTSRVRLAVGPERLLPLEGLPCPEVEDQDRIESFDAARLFVRAAQRVEPGLVPSVEAASIVEICRLVEGLPLALELAAAWTRVLSCDAIASELRQSTELLQAVDAAHPPRHASFQMVFDQSWRMLSAVEREALARLSVFHGGFPAEAARAIAGAPLPVLGALADKSLLRKDGARIFLHPLVQQLAAARLADGAADAATHAAHASYFHRLLAQLTSTASAGQRTALQMIDIEFDNCRRAWTWSMEHGRADALARSAVTLTEYCDYRGRFEEGLGLMRAALDSPVARTDPKLRALLLSKTAHFEYRLGRYAEGEATASLALAVAPDDAEPAMKIQALNVLATSALQTGRLEDARRYFKEVLDITTPENHAHRLAVTLDHLGLVEKHLGNYDESLRLASQSLIQHQQLGDRAGESLCLNNLGSLSLARQEYEAADAYLKQGLAICEQDGFVSNRAYLLSNLTEVAIRTGRLAAAEDYAARALDVANSIGNRGILSWAKLMMCVLAIRRGDLDAARAALAEGLAMAIAIGALSLKLDGVRCFAEILEAQQETLCAHRVLTYVAGHPIAFRRAQQEFRRLLAKLPVSADAEFAWPELEFDDLLHRIVSESGIAHAPLIATLRGELVH